MPGVAQMRSSIRHDLKGRVLQLHFGRFLNPQEHSQPCDASKTAGDHDVGVKVKISIRASKTSPPIRHSSAAIIKIVNCHDKAYYHLQPDTPIELAIEDASSEGSADLNLTIQIDKSFDERLNHNTPLVSCDPFRQTGLSKPASRLLMRGVLPLTPNTPFKLDLARAIDSSSLNRPGISFIDPTVALEVCHHWTHSRDTKDRCASLFMRPASLQLSESKALVESNNPSFTQSKPTSPTRTRGTGSVSLDKARPFDRFGVINNFRETKPQNQDSILHGSLDTGLSPNTPYSKHARISMPVMESRDGSSIGSLSDPNHASPQSRTYNRRQILPLPIAHTSNLSSPEPTVEVETIADSLDSSGPRKRRKRNGHDVVVGKAETNETIDTSSMFTQTFKPNDLRRSVATFRLSPSRALPNRQAVLLRETSSSTSTDRGTRSISEAVSSVTSLEDVATATPKSILAHKLGSPSEKQSIERITSKSVIETMKMDKTVVPTFAQTIPFRNTLPTRTKTKYRVPKAPDKASLYSSVSKTRLQMGELLSESDDENGKACIWETLKDDNELDILRDPDNDQKRFIRMWNRHVRHEDLHADKYVAGSWLRFSRAYTEELDEPAMQREFCVRAGLEKMDGRLTDEIISESIRIITAAKTQDFIHDHSTGTRIWEGTCLCGKVLSDGYNSVVCSNEVRNRANGQS